ncbi:MAG: PQQ-binding-like beta-propeller repeat protein [Candidatus Aenigmarchaeota archaeon]|nr:PQQ-binding-like beta-propeller repeat protein [Candidatus Aenigmarchaeota archaeon]
MDFDAFETELMTIKQKDPTLARRLWSYEQGGGLDTTIVEHEGVIYLGCNDYYMYGLDPKNGRKVWEFKTTGCINTIEPQIHDGVIFFGSYDNYIYAVEIYTRNVVWKFKTGGIADSSCAVSDGVVYAASRDGYIYALDEKTGHEKWRYKTGDIITTNLTVFEEKIFSGCFDGYLYCIDKNTGREIWRFKTNGNITNSHKFLIVDRIIFFGSHDRYVYALSVDKGAEVWRFKGGGGFSTTPALLNNMIIIGCRDGCIYAINKDSGHEVWRFQGQMKPWGFGTPKPLITKKSICASSSASRVYCLDHSGKLKWEFKTEDCVWCGPHYHDGKVIFGCEDCRAYAVDEKTGEEVWRFHSSLAAQKIPYVEDNFSPYEMEVRKSEDDTREGFEDDRYKINFGGLDGLSDSEYSTRSEYVHKSEYTNHSDYK